MDDRQTATKSTLPVLQQPETKNRINTKKGFQDSNRLGNHTPQVPSTFRAANADRYQPITCE